MVNERSKSGQQGSQKVSKMWRNSVFFAPFLFNQKKKKYFIKYRVIISTTLSFIKGCHQVRRKILRSNFLTIFRIFFWRNFKPTQQVFLLSQEVNGLAKYLMGPFQEAMKIRWNPQWSYRFSQKIFSMSTKRKAKMI